MSAYMIVDQDVFDRDGLAYCGKVAGKGRDSPNATVANKVVEKRSGTMSALGAHKQPNAQNDLARFGALADGL